MLQPVLLSKEKMKLSCWALCLLTRPNRQISRVLPWSLVQQQLRYLSVKESVTGRLSPHQEMDKLEQAGTEHGIVS